MHLRAPSVDKGVSAFWWAFFFFLYLFFGMLAVGVAKGSALIFSALLGLGIFFYIRIYGDESPRDLAAQVTNSLARTRDAQDP